MLLTSFSRVPKHTFQLLLGDPESDGICRLSSEFRVSSWAVPDKPLMDGDILIRRLNHLNWPFFSDSTPSSLWMSDLLTLSLSRLNPSYCRERSVESPAGCLLPETRTSTLTSAFNFNALPTLSHPSLFSPINHNHSDNITFFITTENYKCL